MSDNQALGSGDLCPACQRGNLCIRSSAKRGVVQVRYLRCHLCDHRVRRTDDAATIHRRKGRAVGHNAPSAEPIAAGEERSNDTDTDPNPACARQGPDQTSLVA